MLQGILSYTTDVVAPLVVQYGSVSLVEGSLFLVTCVIVYLYSSFTAASTTSEAPSAKRISQWNDANCSQTQQCAGAILHLCQNRSSHQKGLQMYVEHRDHITKEKNPFMHDWESFFYHLLIAVSRCGPPQLSSEIFAHRHRLGVPPTASLYEVAMKMLAGKHLYSEALNVYDESVKEGLTLSAVSYSCLINFAIEVDQQHRAIAFFEKLSEITTPSIRAYMSILRLYSRKKMWKESVGILEHMQSRDVPLDSLVLNIVLGACVRAEELAVAEELLEKYESVRDVISFNNILKGYAHTHQYQEALAMTKRMKDTGVNPTMVTYNTVMDACVRSRQYQHAWEVAQGAEFRADKYTLSILVKTVATMRWKIPTFLDYLSALHVDDPQSALPVIFTTVVDALSEEPNLECLQRVTREAKKRNVSLCFPCLTTLMRCQWILRAADDAFQVWVDLLNNRMPTVAFFQQTLDLTLHLRGCGNNKPFADVVQWARRKSHCPEIDALVQLLVKALLRQKRLGEAMDIYLDMTKPAKSGKARRHNFDLTFYTTLIKAQVSDETQSAVERAMKLVEDMRAQNMQPEPQSIVCILQSCLRRTDMEAARTALLGMQLMSVKPSEHALATVLRLQLKVGEWAEAMKLLQNMTNLYSVTPTMSTITFVIQGFAKMRQSHMVLTLYDWLREHKLKRDVLICNTALKVCASENFFAAGLEIADDAAQQNIKPREGVTELLNAATRARNEGTFPAGTTYEELYRLVHEKWSF